MSGDEALKEFLYLLARDHLPTGVIRGIISSHLQHEPTQEREFSDLHLEVWASERAVEILSIERPTPGAGKVVR